MILSVANGSKPPDACQQPMRVVIPGGSSGSTTALCPVGSRVYLAISGETKLHWVRV